LIRVAAKSRTSYAGLKLELCEGMMNFERNLRASNNACASEKPRKASITIRRGEESCGAKRRKMERAFRNATRRDLPCIKHDEINLRDKCPPLSNLRLRRDAAINVPRDLDELPSRGSDFNQTLAYISPGLLNSGLKNEEA